MDAVKVKSGDKMGVFLAKNHGRLAQKPKAVLEFCAEPSGKGRGLKMQ